MRILGVQMNSIVGDLEGNRRKILEALDRARDVNADIVLFPQMALSGYPPRDLLFDSTFIEALEKTAQMIADSTRGLFAVIGLPRRNRESTLFNSAAVFRDGKLIGFHDKQALSSHGAFDERCYFDAGEQITIFECFGRKVAVAISEDLWRDARKNSMRELEEREVDLILNLASFPYSYGMKRERIEAFSLVAKTLHSPLVASCQVGGNDELVFDGHSMYFNEKGELIQMAKGFVEDELLVDLNVHACACAFKHAELPELYEALVLGVRDYFQKIGLAKALIGLSGGVDSALAACIAVDALGKDNVSAIHLPSRFTSSTSREDSKLLAKRLLVDFVEIEIESLFQPALDLLEPFFEGRSWDTSEENLQARIRSQILMAFANKFNSVLLNTGNKSEFAMGYTTLYGDLTGGFGVLLDVSKTRVYALANYVNRNGEIIPESILNKAPSAELRENQTDQDTLPPYAVLDPIIEDLVEKGLSLEETAKKRGVSVSFVRDLATRMYRAEYKRRQAPIGTRVTEKSFGAGWMIPIVQKWRMS